MQLPTDTALFRHYEGDTLAGLFMKFLKTCCQWWLQKYQGSQGIDCFKYIGLEVTYGKHITAKKEYISSTSEIPINI